MGLQTVVIESVEEKMRYERTQSGVGIATLSKEKWLPAAFWWHLRRWIGFHQDKIKS